MKKAVKSILNRLGYEIRKIPVKPGWDATNTMFGALSRCIKRGLEVNTVIDVGASNASWSDECMKHLPNANYLLIEAQAPHRQRLESFVKQHNNAEYLLAVAGDKPGKIHFDNSDLFGGVASKSAFEKNSVQLPMTSIDKEIAERALEPPYILKLDTHGFEIPILQGAEEMLKQTELVIIETYNYKISPESVLHHQMCAFMSEKGFRVVDIVDPYRRLSDLALWQVDTFFVPQNN